MGGRKPRQLPTYLRRNPILSRLVAFPPLIQTNQISQIQFPALINLRSYCSLLLAPPQVQKKRNGVDLSLYHGHRSLTAGPCVSRSNNTTLRCSTDFCWVPQVLLGARALRPAVLQGCIVAICICIPSHGCASCRHNHRDSRSYCHHCTRSCAGRP